MSTQDFVVDYSYKPVGGISTARARAQGSILINLQTARSEFAVVEYLKRRHPGNEIGIFSIVWK